MDPDGVLELLDWKRRVADLYREVREANDPRAAWDRWREVRAELFSTHPQSPIPAAGRAAFPGPHYFDYDPAARVLATVVPAESEAVTIDASEGTMEMVRFATARFELRGNPGRLGVFWLEGYGGGLFLSFRDATSGRTTYGACRYLLDTVKGADLGVLDGKLVLDFNFAYQPSCSYDPRWVCPLAPPGNRLDFEVRAGERLTEGRPL
jgi:uncharacterized protein